MPHVIDSDQCISCGACETECPEDAVREGDGCYLIDPSRCEDCGACATVCPQDCIAGPGGEDLAGDAPGPEHESEYD